MLVSRISPAPRPAIVAGPFYGIEAARLAPAVGVDLPAAGAGGPRVDRDHDGLGAEAVRRLLHEVRVVDRGRC